jgi:hypothetical protein
MDDLGQPTSANQSSFTPHNSSAGYLYINIDHSPDTNASEQMDWWRGEITSRLQANSRHGLAHLPRNTQLRHMELDTGQSLNLDS